MYKQPLSVKLIFEQIATRGLSLNLALTEIVTKHQGTIEEVRFSKNKTHKIERVEVIFPDHGGIAVTRSTAIVGSTGSTMHYKEI